MKIIKGDLLLTEDTTFNEDLKVEGDIKGYYNLKVIGNIDCWDIDCRNIDCWDIDCRNIVCWDIYCRDIDCGDIDCGNIDCENIIYCNNIKVKEGCKVICKALIKDRFSIEKKEQKLK